jgi:hypothetical protein
MMCVCSQFYCLVPAFRAMHDTTGHRIHCHPQVGLIYLAFTIITAPRFIQPLLIQRGKPVENWHDYLSFRGSQLLSRPSLLDREKPDQLSQQFTTGAFIQGRSHDSEDNLHCIWVVATTSRSLSAFSLFFVMRRVNHDSWHKHCSGVGGVDFDIVDALRPAEAVE